MIVVFAMPSCPACQDYKPRFDRQVKGFKSYGVPFVDYRSDRAVARGTIPIVVIDAASQDPSVVSFADQYAVSALPCTILFIANGKPTKFEGAIADGEIYEILRAAAEANC